MFDIYILFFFSFKTFKNLMRIFFFLYIQRKKAKEFRCIKCQTTEFALSFPVL